MRANHPVARLSENTGSATDERGGVQALSLLYTENAKMAAAFWEWRHKVMERFFAAFAAIVVVGGWMYQRKELKRLIFIPLLLGAVYSIISYLMDRVNKRILLDCYATGKEIEQQLGSSSGPYTRISNHYERVNYSVFFRALYLSAAVLLLAIGVLAAVFVR